MASKNKLDESNFGATNLDSLIVQFSPDGVCVVGPDGCIREVNRAYCTLVGYAERELIGRHLSDLEANEDAQEIERHIQHVIRDGSDRFETRHRRKDGSEIALEVHVRYVEFGDETFFVSLFRDISERARSQQRIEQLDRIRRTISAVTKLVVRESDPQRLLAATCRILHEDAGYRMAWVGMADFVTGEVRVVAHAGMHEDYLREIHIRCDDSPEGRGPTGTAIRTSHYVINNDSETDGLFALWRAAATARGFRSSAAFPLFVGGKVVGAINVYAVETDAFDEREIALLSELSDEVGYALQALEDSTQRQRAELQAAKSDEFLRSLYEASPDMIFFHGPDGSLIDVNDQVLSAYGCTREEMLTLPPETWMGEGYSKEQTWELLERVRRGERVDFEWMARRKNGEEFPVDVRLRAMDGALAECEGMVVAVVRDLTERRHADAERNRLSSAIRQTADVVIITDTSGVIEFVNPAFERATGYSRAEVLGRTPSVIKSGVHELAFYREMWAKILAGEVFRDVLVNRRKDGSLYYEEKTITPLFNERGKLTHFVSTGKDVTEILQTQERLQYLAQHDLLTGLPNRALMMDRLQQDLARAARGVHQVGVLFLDLDRFKLINDSLGHEAGDDVLRTLAKRIGAVLRDGDTVARVGGDEFAVVLGDLRSPAEATDLARKILESLAHTVDFQAHEFVVTASMGVAVYPQDGGDEQTLLKHAGIAMYRAKDRGRNSYSWYSPEMGARSFDRLNLETSLRRALDRQEFEVFYQPQVDIASERIVGLEALLRWRHPDFGLIAPGDFIAILEETGLIVPVGKWVLQTVCKQIAVWQDTDVGELQVAVNLSARQFHQPDLYDFLLQSTHETGIAPQRIELEITESLLIEQERHTQQLMQSLAAAGFRFAIDDFGTGYCALSYLKRFPISTLKIDRSFIADVDNDPDDAAIVCAIIAMARSLKLEVIAEGVETERQRDVLREWDCQCLQGFLISASRPVQEVTALLEQRGCQRYSRSTYSQAPKMGRPQ